VVEVVCQCDAFAPSCCAVLCCFSRATVKTLAQRTDSVNAACISPDGGVLCCAAYDGALTFWDVKTGRFLTAIEGHKGRIGCCCFR
jgi:WD40 repeat protein